MNRGYGNVEEVINYNIINMYWLLMLRYIVKMSRSASQLAQKHQHIIKMFGQML